MTATKKQINFYTLGEEIANAITHGLGCSLAIAGSVILIVFSVISQDPWKIVSSSVYGFSMIILFLNSTIYHSLTHPAAKSVFRILDHSSINLLIAGTYTPLTLVMLKGAVGWIIFAVVWISAILGIVFNSINLEKFKKFSMITYIASGWCIIIALVPLIKKLSVLGIILLFFGGIMFTVGILFYRKKSIKFMHSIWHIFVLAGVISHYFCILFFVILA